jgi:hypothetical protein
MAQEMMEEHIQLQSAPSIDYQSLEFIAAGGLGIINTIDEKRNLKEIGSTFATADSVHPTSRDAFVGGYCRK